MSATEGPDPAGSPMDDSTRSETPTLGRRIAESKEKKRMAKSSVRGRDAEVIEAHAEQQAQAALGFIARNATKMALALAVVCAAAAGIFAFVEYSKRGGSRELAKYAQALEISTATVRGKDVGAADVQGLSFGSTQERAEEARGLYAAYVKDYPKSHAAPWAYAGEGASLFDLGRYADARAAFERALTPDADPQVRIRAIEGIGFAFEAEKKFADAEKTYQRLVSLQVPRAQDWVDYHVARVRAAQGKKDDALKMFVALLQRFDEADKKPDAPSTPYLRNQVELQVLRLNPNALPARSVGSTSSFSEEQIRLLIEKLKAQQQQQEQQQQAPSSDEPTP